MENNNDLASEVLRQTRTRVMPIITQHLSRFVPDGGQLVDVEIALLGRPAKWDDHKDWTRLIYSANKLQGETSEFPGFAWRRARSVSDMRDTISHGEIGRHEVVETMRRCAELADEFREAKFAAWLRALMESARGGMDGSALMLRLKAGPDGSVAPSGEEAHSSRSPSGTHASVDGSHASEDAVQTPPMSPESDPLPSKSTDGPIAHAAPHMDALHRRHDVFPWLLGLILLLLLVGGWWYKYGRNSVAAPGGPEVGKESTAARPDTIAPAQPAGKGMPKQPKKAEQPPARGRTSAAAESVDVHLFLPTTMTNADVTVDGAVALIRDQNDYGVWIRTTAGPQPRRITVTKGEKQCSLTRILADTMELFPCGD